MGLLDNINKNLEEEAAKQRAKAAAKNAEDEAQAERKRIEEELLASQKLAKKMNPNDNSLPPA